MLGASSHPLDCTPHYAAPRTAHDGIKVHAKYTNRRVVVCTKANVSLNPETEVAGL